jgi:hypothetical protein
MGVLVGAVMATVPTTPSPSSAVGWRSSIEPMFNRPSQPGRLGAGPRSGPFDEAIIVRRRAAGSDP